MARIEFLLEEESMREVLQVILPKLLPSEWKLNENYFLRPHEGKSDLRKSIPRKIKALLHYKEPVGLIILHDQDSNDCHRLKQDLIDLCTQSGSLPCLIRIVCRELEAWYLGDMPAIQAAYSHFKPDRYQNKAKFRNPDNCNAYDDLKSILPEFQKVTSAKMIAPCLNVANNRSASFQNFITGLNRFIGQFSN